jgi:hypothetical protein
VSFAMTQEWKSRLLRPRLVRSDIFIQGLEPDELEMIREASERGLTPRRVLGRRGHPNPSVRPERVAEAFVRRSERLRRML